MIGRTALFLLSLVVALSTSPAFAQAPAKPIEKPSKPVADAASPFAQERVYSSGAGMLFHPIQKAKTKQFEAVIQRVREALQSSTNPKRRQQAKGWKVYRVIEPGPHDSVLYIFVMDPAVASADYTIGEILREELPLEAQKLYETFASSYAYSPSLINLALVADFNKSPAAAPKPGDR